MKNLKITFLLFIMLGLFNMSYAQDQIKSKKGEQICKVDCKKKCCEVKKEKYSPDQKVKKSCKADCKSKCCDKNTTKSGTKDAKASKCGASCKSKCCAGKKTMEKQTPSETKPLKGKPSGQVHSKSCAKTCCAGKKN